MIHLPILPAIDDNLAQHSFQFLQKCRTGPILAIRWRRCCRLYVSALGFPLCSRSRFACYSVNQIQRIKFGRTCCLFVIPVQHGHKLCIGLCRVRANRATMRVSCDAVQSSWYVAHTPMLSMASFTAVSTVEGDGAFPFDKTAFNVRSKS